MLLVFMYHRISHTGFANDIQAFSEHLAYLSKNYSIVLPGDPINHGQLSICLTFDDAYFDFYHYVFPLLKQLQIPAVLAVPVNYIIDQSPVDVEQRLAVDSLVSMDGDHYQTSVPFCTWPELQEMAESPFVNIASHSSSHDNLVKPGVALEREIIDSKTQLETRLNTTVNTFIYPYGSMNNDVHKMVSQHYQYGMRIGSALNRSWSEKNGLIYRVDANKFWPHGTRWSSKHTAKHALKYISNKVRGK